MNRAESALATTKRLAEVAAEEKRLGRIVTAANMCDAGGEVYDADYGGRLRVSHLTAYLRGDGTVRARMRECPVCSAAYQAIQDRRALRRRRGALRAALVRIGKLALKEATR